MAECDFDDSAFINDLGGQSNRCMFMPGRPVRGGHKSSILVHLFAKRKAIGNQQDYQVQEYLAALKSEI